MTAPKDLDLGTAGGMRLVGVVSRNEEERCAKLGAYYRQFLGSWMEQVVSGVRYSPGANREMMSALLEMAAAAALSDPRVADEVIERHAQDFVRQALELLEVHAQAQLAEAGINQGTPA